MDLQKAIDLINFSGNIKLSEPMYWADLGCGNGTFTTALSYILPKKSHIRGVDVEVQHLFNEPKDGISVDFLKADFQKNRLLLPPVDGFLMANSLHYVKDKKALLEKLKQYMKPKHYWLIVEYDTQMANQWVPYPINAESLQQLFLEIGYKNIHYLRQVPSRYGHGNIYASIIASPNS